MSQAEYFNKVRRIIFSTAHKYGFEKAEEYIEGYRNKLGPTGYAGLKAELYFYKNNRTEFKLSVAADVGDHTDFSGFLGNEVYRFDVTTNADYKKLKEYEPLQKGVDAKYKIALMDNSGNLQDLIDINFPFCPECQEGRLIDIGILLGENYNSRGESQWTNDQLLIGACSHCDYFEEQNRISTHFLFDYSTKIQNALDAERDRLDYLESIGRPAVFDADNIIYQHSMSVLPYLHRQFDKTLIGLGSRHYEITDPRDGDGYFMTKLMWQKNLKIFEDYLREDYEFDVE
ncbi:MAG: hypothetical protein ACK5L8_02210 [Marinicella pacifica]